MTIRAIRQLVEGIKKVLSYHAIFYSLCERIVVVETWPLLHSDTYVISIEFKANIDQFVE